MRKAIVAKKLRVVVPASLLWIAVAFGATHASSPTDLLPALAILGSPLVGFGWGWALEVPR
ncbi:MAG TPA: hypothetical protein VFM93_00655 [Candidatus Limnocylindria bacterium]|nr:hypothetical protein [Candidatus Limnocylindria bacterium]